MNQICFKTLRTGFQFSCENSSGSLFFKNQYQFSKPVLTWVGTLKQIFNPIFTQNQNTTENQSENQITQWEPPNTGIYTVCLNFFLMIVSINFDTRPDALWGFGAISHTRLTLVIL